MRLTSGGMILMVLQDESEITKRRAVAEDMLEHKVVFINNVAVKKAKDVKVGDTIEIKYLEYIDTFKVLQIPTTKSTPKSQQEEYVEKLKRITNV